MPTSPVKTRIPLTSFGHMITEVKKQLFGIEAPATVELTGWRRHFNTYTLQGRRNSDLTDLKRFLDAQFVLVTYAALALGAAAYAVHRRSTQEVRKEGTSSQA